MTEDGRRDEIIKRAAILSYNPPPVTPREDMWTAIQAARSTSAAGPRLHVEAGGATIPAGYKAETRFAPRSAWFGLAAAAVLLIATGVGIGRWTSRASSSAPTTIANPAVAVAAAPTLSAPDSEPTLAPQSGLSTATPSPTGGEATTAKPRTREEIRKSPQIIGRGGLRLASGSRNDSRRESLVGPTAVSYQVATQKHLENAEALLTSYVLEGNDPKMDAQFAGWAKGLLSNTRLLLDSPAGDDPRRAKLLQDLELVLAQIVQLSPNAAAQDRELIQGSIQKGHVMTRLRSAIPADQPRGILEK